MGSPFKPKPLVNQKGLLYILRRHINSITGTFSGFNRILESHFVVLETDPALTWPPGGWMAAARNSPPPPTSPNQAIWHGSHRNVIYYQPLDPPSWGCGTGDWLQMINNQWNERRRAKIKKNIYEDDKKTNKKKQTNTWWVTSCLTSRGSVLRSRRVGGWQGSVDRAVWSVCACIQTVEENSNKKKNNRKYRYIRQCLMYRNNRH